MYSLVTIDSLNGRLQSNKLITSALGGVGASNGSASQLRRTRFPVSQIGETRRLNAQSDDPLPTPTAYYFLSGRTRAVESSLRLVFSNCCRRSIISNGFCLGWIQSRPIAFDRWKLLFGHSAHFYWQFQTAESEL